MTLVVAIGDTEYAWCTSEDSSPVACCHFLRRGLKGIVACCCLCITVGGVIVLELETCKQVMLAQCDVHLIGDHRILRLSEVAVGEDIACERPSGVVILTIVHDDLNNWCCIAILCRTWLILE